MAAFQPSISIPHSRYEHTAPSIARSLSPAVNIARIPYRRLTGMGSISAHRLAEADRWRRCQAAVSRACDSSPPQFVRVEVMKFRLVMQWPSSDILPLVQEARTATAALEMCLASMRGGCEIKSIFKTDEAGAMEAMLLRELVRLAREEGCRIRFPPRARRSRKAVSSVVLALLASLLPNNFGDFCTLLDFGPCRVAIRREEGARRPAGRTGRTSEASPSPIGRKGPWRGCASDRRGVWPVLPCSPSPP